MDGLGIGKKGVVADGQIAGGGVGLERAARQAEKRMARRPRVDEGAELAVAGVDEHVRDPREEAQDVGVQAVGHDDRRARDEVEAELRAPAGEARVHGADERRRRAGHVRAAGRALAAVAGDRAQEALAEARAEVAGLSLHPVDHAAAGGRQQPRAPALGVGAGEPQRLALGRAVTGPAADAERRVGAQVDRRPRRQHPRARGAPGVAAQDREAGMRCQCRRRADAVLLAVEPQGLRQGDDRVVAVGADHALAQALVLRPLVAEVAAAVEQDDAVRPDRAPHGARVVAMHLALVGDVRAEQAQGLGLTEPDRRVADVRVIRVVDQRDARAGAHVASDGGGRTRSRRAGTVAARS